MLVNSVGSFSLNRVNNLTAPKNSNIFEYLSFNGLSTSTKQTKKMSFPIFMMLASMLLGTLAIINSCKPINSEPLPTATPTNSPTKTPLPTPTTTPTAKVSATPTSTSVVTPTPTVTQFLVQPEMSNIAKALGLNAPLTEITNINYSDGGEGTVNKLSLNKSESTDFERVYDGTSVNQEMGGTTSYVRYRITNPSGDGTVVKVYKTSDGKPPSAATTWLPDKKFKYITDASGVEKYSLNLDGSINELLATILPDTESSLIVMTSSGDIYQISFN